MLRRRRQRWPQRTSWTLLAIFGLSTLGCSFDANSLRHPAREAAAEPRDVGPEGERGDVQGGRAESGGTDLRPETAGLFETGPEVGASDSAGDATSLAKDGGITVDAPVASEDVVPARSSDADDGPAGGGENRDSGDAPASPGENADSRQDRVADRGEDTGHGGEQADVGRDMVTGDAADGGTTLDAYGPAADAGLGNLALAGTAYRWSGNSSSTANTNRVAETKLNDDSTATEVNLAGNGWDQVENAWEAAGVILARAATVTRVVYVNGSFTRTTLGGTTYSGDGNFVANFRLQLSTDGSVWTDATGWSLAPAYPHDGSASNLSYVFTGNAPGVLGVRITGQVRLNNSLDVSWNATSREIQVWGSN